MSVVWAKQNPVRFYIHGPFVKINTLKLLPKHVYGKFVLFLTLKTKNIKLYGSFKSVAHWISEMRGGGGGEDTTCD